MSGIGYIFVVAGAFGYTAAGIGVLSLAMVIVHIIVSMPWSRIMSLILLVLPVAIGALGWVVYRSNVTTALEYITTDTVELSREHAPESMDAEQLRREFAERGYSEARYPFYIGSAFFALSAVFWVLAEIRYRGKRKSRISGTTA